MFMGQSSMQMAEETRYFVRIVIKWILRLSEADESLPGGMRQP